jgi:hypothetical protein
MLYPVFVALLRCGRQGALLCCRLESVLRAAGLLQGDKSHRMLQLTADMIDSNSADYTAWQHRWDTLVELQADLQQEYAFTE